MLRILLLLLTVAATTLAGCDRQVPVREERARPVRTVVVEASRTSITLELPGEVRPRVETRYGFRVGGKIAERLVSVGDRVQPGQRLARLDPQDVAPAVAAARAQREAALTDLKLARIELERLKELRGLNYVSQAQVDRQQAQTDSAVSRLRSAEAQLAQATNSAAFQSLVADDAGVVTAIEAEAGQVVAAGQPVVKVARTGEMELLVYVPEADLANAKGARAWQVAIPALGDRLIPATVRELSPVADPASRTYPMRLSLGGDLSSVALGMTATARAVRESGEAIVLPMSALHATGDTPKVWVVGEDLTVRSVEVGTGGLLDDAVRIVSGLKPGDRVVTAGANLLREGQQVRLADDASGAVR
ncbi:MAG: efflux RND transporter periplasmic adaptor subunit [Gammaproteobacteria bacterium]|jgi:RND family efflux transporter MFP subunit